jgi:alanine racemase
MPDGVSAEDYRLARPVWTDISLGAITENLEEVRKLVGRPVKVIATIKADAYGLGAVAIGRHLEGLGVNGLATANFDDAVALRENGVKIPIVLFASNLPSGVKTLLRYDLTPSLYDLQTAKILSTVATRTVNVHVKVDDGLGRLGVKLVDARRFIQSVRQFPNINVEGVYTHIAFSNDAGEAWSRRRLAAFVELIGKLEQEDGLKLDFAQASASSTIICGFPDTLNTIAPGHLLFGLCPVQKQLVRTWPFKHAFKSLKARLIHTVQHNPGDDLAISGQYALRNAMRTGVILLGLDNGFRMPVTSGAYALCGGKRCSIVSVTAEYTVIDLAAAPEADVGDEVTIVGRDGAEAISLDQVGEYLGVGATIASLDLRRIPVHYTDNDFSR